ncbi:hypothetical protein [Streptomyces antibioticus]|uniref:hypothetical protein n=1 Tax=Streptomyces antibioticus TaxID=1890 RepID=UPI0033A1CC54
MIGRRGYGLDVVILDEVAGWARDVQLIQEWQVVWPRRKGKTEYTTRLRDALRTEVTVTYPVGAGLARAMRALDAALAARRTRMLARLADDLHRPLFLVRRQADAVDHILETTGMADGYGQLTPTATRRPVPPPSRTRRPSYDHAPA